MDKSEQAVALFDKLAELYAQKYNDVSLYTEALDYFCTLVAADATLLDVACGPGNITKYIAERLPTVSITGMDLADNMLRIAAENVPNAKFINMDARLIAKLQSRYSAVVCAFCFPYLSQEEVVQFVADATNVLQNDGVFYLSFIEGPYLQSGYEKSSTGEEVYMHYHEAKYMQDAFMQNGLEILQTYRMAYQTQYGKPCNDCVIIAMLK